MEDNLEIITYVYTDYVYEKNIKYEPFPLEDLEEYGIRKIVLDSIRTLIGNNFEMEIVEYEHWPHEYIKIKYKLASKEVLKDFINKMSNKYIKLDYKLDNKNNSNIKLFVKFETIKIPKTSVAS